MEDWELADQDRRFVIAAWTLAIVACCIAAIPVVGFVSWIISGPILLATFILAIVLLTRGVIGQGVALLFMSMIVAPAVIFIAPIVTTMIPAFISARKESEAQNDKNRMHETNRPSDLRANTTPMSLPSVGSKVLIQRAVKVNIPRGEVIIPAGDRVKLLKITQSVLYVEYDGYTVPIPLTAVDASKE